MTQHETPQLIMRRLILYVIGWIAYVLGDGITAHDAWTDGQREPLDARRLAEGVKLILNIGE